jgi:hypothetical protein
VCSCTLIFLYVHPIEQLNVTFSVTIMSSFLKLLHKPLFIGVAHLWSYSYKAVFFNSFEIKNHMCWLVLLVVLHMTNNRVYLIYTPYSLGPRPRVPYCYILLITLRNLCELTSEIHLICCNIAFLKCL